MRSAALWLLTAAQAVIVATPALATTYFPPSFATPSVDCATNGDGKLQPILHPFAASWFSGHLAAAEEPSLYEVSLKARDGDHRTLRFTWLRSFDTPVVIRIEMTGPASGHVLAKELSGAGGYDPGSVARRLDRMLTADEIGMLDALLTRTQVLAQSPSDCTLGLDGAEWIVEGVDEQGYHFVDRWSPDSGPVREFGEFMISLSGWKFTDVY
jgi:hypothetical protein